MQKIISHRLMVGCWLKPNRVVSWQGLYNCWNSLMKILEIFWNLTDSLTQGSVQLVSYVRNRAAFNSFNSVNKVRASEDHEGSTEDSTISRVEHKRKIAKSSLCCVVCSRAAKHQNRSVFEASMKLCTRVGPPKGRWKKYPQHIRAPWWPPS